MRRSLVFWMHIPGWRSAVSTRDLRTREQRDEDRKKRQLEKLPKPELLWGPQYEFKKTVLCDAWFQPVVYEDELDTPRLFSHAKHVPMNFILRSDLSTLLHKKDYPPLPTMDLRTLTCSEWVNRSERSAAMRYMRKHGLVPTIWAGTRIHDDVSEVPHTAIQLNGSLHNPQDFWRAAHYGNYVEVGEMQRSPSVTVRRQAPKQIGNTSETSPPLYTLFLICPDHPARSKPDDGFLLHYVETNIPAILECPAHPERLAQSEPCRGVPVVPYLPPLPTEDAGAMRYIYVLYEQKYPVTWGPFIEAGSKHEDANISPPSWKDMCFVPEKSDRSVAHCNRNQNRLEARKRYQIGATSSKEYNACLTSEQTQLRQTLLPVEEALVDPSHPCWIHLVHSDWDLPVTEWYESHSMDEPSYVGEDVCAEVQRNGHISAYTQMRPSRYAPNGSLLKERAVSYERPQFLNFTIPGWSRRARMPIQGSPRVSPHRFRY